MRLALLVLGWSSAIAVAAAVACLNGLGNDQLAAAHPAKRTGFVPRIVFSSLSRRGIHAFLEMLK